MNTPPAHITVNTINEVFITFTSTCGSADARGVLPMNLLTIIVTITMLSVCPMDRIVASMDDATPYSDLSTHDITALVLGDENSEKPRPVTSKAIIIITRLVSCPMKINIAAPAAQKPMPTDDILNGENLSDILPIIGESTAMTIGWNIIMSPAVWDE